MTEFVDFSNITSVVVVAHSNLHVEMAFVILARWDVTTAGEPLGAS